MKSPSSLRGFFNACLAAGAFSMPASLLELSSMTALLLELSSMTALLLELSSMTALLLELSSMTALLLELSSMPALLLGLLQCLPYCWGFFNACLAAGAFSMTALLLKLKIKQCKYKQRKNT